MSEFPLWSTLIRQTAPKALREMYPSPIEKSNPAPLGLAEKDVEQDKIEEDEMTSGEKSERERLVKSMKKGDWSRYGSRAKDVMYATATKRAMGESVHMDQTLKRALIQMYKENEANNDHTGNAELLIRLFGTPQEIQLAIKLWDIREKEGGIDMEKNGALYKRVSALHSKYYRQLMSTAPLREEDDTKYQQYFRMMLKKFGYNSPADIPDDKKDDFFNAVDAGYKAKDESMKTFEVDTVTESDDQEMMSAQLDSLASKSAKLHEMLQHMSLGDVPAWIQTKVANAEKDITAILDYMQFEEKEPKTEMDVTVEADTPTAKSPMVPLRMQAAMVIAKTLGGDRSASQQIDFKPSGGSPEAIVNQAIRYWLQGSHTNEGWALGAKMLMLAKQMGIKWDDTLLRKKFTPQSLKKLGLSEAVPATQTQSQGDSDMERLHQRQDQEKDTMELRHEREKLSQKEHDAEEKIRQQQLKRTQQKQTATAHRYGYR